MPDFTVIAVFSASASATVNAPTAEEAADKAGDMDFTEPMLCHECSKEVELSDLAGFIVDDGDSILFDDTPRELDRQTIADLRETITENALSFQEQCKQSNKVGFISGVVYSAGMLWRHDSVGAREMLIGALGPNMDDIELGSEYDLKQLIEAKANINGLHHAWQIARKREQAEARQDRKDREQAAKEGMQL